MIKFPTNLTTSLDELIALAMQEYETKRKISDRTWLEKKQKFSAARDEWTYGVRESRITFATYAAQPARVEWVIRDGIATPQFVEG